MKPTRSARCLFLLAASLPGATTASHGQRTPPKRRVAVFSPAVKGRDDAFITPFYEEVRRLGWVEARDLAYDRVYGDDNMEGMAAVAAAIAALRGEPALGVAERLRMQLAGANPPEPASRVGRGASPD